MPKFAHSDRSPNPLLMGAGAVIGELSITGPRNPSLRDLRSLQRDQLVVADDFHRAMGMVQQELSPGIAPPVEEAHDKSGR